MDQFFIFTAETNITKLFAYEETIRNIQPKIEKKYIMTCARS